MKHPTVLRHSPSRSAPLSSPSLAAIAVIFATALILGATLLGMAASSAGAGQPTVTRPGPGYWLVSGDGGVFAFGRADYQGSTAARELNAPIVGVAASPTGLGYWMVGSDGGVFAFGDAPWKGSVPSSIHRAPASPIVGIAATPTGRGYWLVGSDGGVFAFGDAPFVGSLSSAAHPAPIVGMAATPTGRGYWLVASDGSIYSFGDARYLGGVPSSISNSVIVGMAVTPTGHGYWLAAADGGVFSFGDAVFAGSLAGRPHLPIVGVAPAPRGMGYWLAGADGGVFAFGSAGYYGSVGSSRLNQGVVAIASGSGVAIPQTPTSPVMASGFDISWPQCDRIRPAPPYGFGVVGVTDGHLFSTNPCLAQQWAWATGNGSFAAVYLNTDAPPLNQLVGLSVAKAWGCADLDMACVLDQWGRQGVLQALRAAGPISAPMWWLDVETGNQWLPETGANAIVLNGMIQQLEAAGKHVGLYSTSQQWKQIAGGFAPQLPVWIPGAPPADASAYCNGEAFGNGVAWMAQSGDGTFDTDVLCAPGLANYQTAFAPPAPLQVPEYPPSPVVTPLVPTTAASPHTTPPRSSVAIPPLFVPSPGLAVAAPAALRHRHLNWGPDLLLLFALAGLLAHAGRRRSTLESSGVWPD